jgi:hypothetical protein
VKRSDLAGYVGYGYCASHSRFYWGSKLLLIVTCDGTVTGFALANPKLDGERETVRVKSSRANPLVGHDGGAGGGAVRGLFPQHASASRPSSGR